MKPTPYILFLLIVFSMGCAQPDRQEHCLGFEPDLFYSWFPYRQAGDTFTFTDGVAKTETIVVKSSYYDKEQVRTFSYNNPNQHCTRYAKVGLEMYLSITEPRFFTYAEIWGFQNPDGKSIGTSMQLEMMGIDRASFTFKDDIPDSLFYPEYDSTYWTDEQKKQRFQVAYYDRKEIGAAVFDAVAEIAISYTDHPPKTYIDRIYIARNMGIVGYRYEGITPATFRLQQ